MSKTIDKYTQKDLEDLINGLDIPPKAKEKTIKVLIQYKYKGTDMRVKSAQDVEDLGFPSFVSNKFYEAINSKPKPKAKPKMSEEEKKRKIAEGLRKREQRAKNDGTSGAFTQDGQNFKVKFFYSAKSRTTQQFFNSSTKVETIQQYIIGCETGGNTKDFQLVAMGDVLDGNKTLRDYEITKDIEIAVVKKVIGGAQMGEDEKSYYYNSNERERIPDWTNTSIEATTDPDCITLEDDEETLRVKMPCGHVFDPTTLFRIAKMCTEESKYTAVICPVVECKDIWNFSIVIAACDLDQTESSNFQRILSNRKAIAAGSHQECQGCGNLVTKPESLTLKRVRCTNNYCTFGDFCWICGQTWKRGGYAVCGNNNCSTIKLNEALTNAAKPQNKVKSLWSNINAKCPGLRACPRCYTLVKHQEACKHVKCWGCNKSFCFMCLALYEDNKWGCKTGNSASGECIMASTQVL